MTTHQINDRWQYGKYDIILRSAGYGLQEVATGNNPLWWDADNFIGGFSTLGHAEIALDMIVHRTIDNPYDLQQVLFALNGI